MGKLKNLKWIMKVADRVWEPTPCLRWKEVNGQMILQQLCRRRGEDSPDNLRWLRVPVASEAQFGYYGPGILLSAWNDPSFE